MDITKEQLISNFEPKRQAANKKASTLLTIGIPLTVIGAILLIITFSSESIEGLLPVFMILSIVAGIALISFGLSIKNKAIKALVTQLRTVVYDKYFPDREENSNMGMSLDEIMYPGFFEHPDRYHMDGFMSAVWDGIPFKQSNYKLERREVHHDKNGTHVEYVTYAQGTMYFFDFEREFGQTVKIIEKKSALGNNRGLKKAETEFIEFNKKFHIYASDETQVFYLLTPQIQEKILALEKVFKGSFHMAFIGSDLWIAINDSGSSVSFSLKEPLTSETIDGLERVIAAPKLLIDNLGLAKVKFKKDAGTVIK